MCLYMCLYTWTHMCGCEGMGMHMYGCVEALNQVSSLIFFSLFPLFTEAVSHTELGAYACWLV